MARTKRIYERGEQFIVASDLTLKNPLHNAYQHVDLDVPFGSLCAVVGENGSGKCELLLTLAGRMRQTGGKLSVGGHSCPLHASRVRRMSGLSFFEKVNEVQPVLSVRSVVAAELNLNSRRSNRKATMAYLEEWGLAEHARAHVESLNRKDRDRLGIALGMACEPQLLVVDDIESDLTRHQSTTLLEELRSIAHERDVTVVVSITDYELARLCDIVVPITESARAQARIVESQLASVDAPAQAPAAPIIEGAVLDHAPAPVVPADPAEGTTMPAAAPVPDSGLNSNGEGNVETIESVEVAGSALPTDAEEGKEGVDHA